MAYKKRISDWSSDVCSSDLTAVMSGSANIDGIDLSAGQADTPEGKAFLALFPFIALSSEDLEAKSIAAMRAVLRSTSESRMGTAEQAYNDAFIPSVRSIVDSYNGYVEGNRTFARVIDDKIGRAHV